MPSVRSVAQRSHHFANLFGLPNAVLQGLALDAIQENSGPPANGAKLELLIIVGQSYNFAGGLIGLSSFAVANASELCML
jgi:hypothetical protein